MKFLSARNTLGTASILVGAAFLFVGFAAFAKRALARQKPDVFDALMGDYEAAVKAGDVAKQTELAAQTLQIAGALAEEDSSPWLRAMEQAHQCEIASDWKGARDAYERAVAGASEQPMLQSNAYSSLSTLYALLNLHDLARETAQKATEAARRDEVSVLLMLRLFTEAECHLHNADLSSAWEKLEEAQALTETNPMHDLQRTQSLILRAKLHIRGGDLANATADLASAWQPLQPHSDSFFMAGYQNALAKWWATQAQLCAAQDDKIGEVEAWRQSVQRRRIIAQLPHIEGVSKHANLADTLEKLAQSLENVGDDLAKASFVESSSIRQAMGLPASSPFG